MYMRLHITLLTGFLLSALLLVVEPVIAAKQSETSSDYGDYDFTVTTLDGKKVKSSDYQDKVVLVNFWETWCPPCVAEIPSLVRLYNKYKNKGFVVIGVTQNSEEDKVQQFIKRFDIPYVIGRDTTGEIGHRYQIFAVPTSFLFAPDGSVKRKVEGGYGEQADEVLGRDVQALLDPTLVPHEGLGSETALADVPTKETPLREVPTAPHPVPVPQGAPQPETAITNKLRAGSSSSGLQASLNTTVAPHETPQLETVSVEVQQKAGEAAYKWWNLAVPLLALIGLLALSCIRLSVAPAEAAGNLPPPMKYPLPAAVPYARLVRQSPIDAVPQEIAFLHDDILIGSGTECDVILRHPSIARQHARVQWRKQGYVLCDLQGAQRTFVNGRPVVENLLKDGWAVRLGVVEFVFYDARLYKH